MTEIRTLETERLILRPWRDSDIDGYAELMHDAERSKFIGGPLSRDDAWRRLATYVGHWSLRGYGVWALEDKATETFVGYSGLWNPLGWPEREITWALRQQFQGRGLIAEAARCVRAYAYEDLGWSTAVSVIAQENTASIRVAERLGAVLGGTTENRGWMCGIYRHESASKVIGSRAP
jgi:RimJ/RimL family protein N-acetyltransferase